MGAFPLPAKFPRVSVLIPARNEEANIRACVESLLMQRYPDFEVLVLNDASSDRTALILDEISRHATRLRVLNGQPLPDGWLGKHWASHQLSQEATGELLLFTDADTRHAPDCLHASVSALVAEGADLLTAVPCEEMLTWGERLTVPILSFSVFCFFPIFLAEKLRLPALSVTIGQFMLFRRTAFEAIGGYEAVRSSLVDDLMLGRNIVNRGYRWKLVDGTRHISCRMYRNFAEAVAGFTKNLFAVFDYHIVLYGVGWFWIAVSFLLPPAVTFSNTLAQRLNFPRSLAAIAVLEALLMFGLAYRRSRVPVFLAALYPVNMLMFAWLATRSFIYNLMGYSAWKGRSLPRPVIRL
jgi:chlorobactene glucosyltransferase